MVIGGNVPAVPVRVLPLWPVLREPILALDLRQKLFVPILVTVCGRFIQNTFLKGRTGDRIAPDHVFDSRQIFLSSFSSSSPLAPLGTSRLVLVYTGHLHLL